MGAVVDTLEARLVKTNPLTITDDRVRAALATVVTLRPLVKRIQGSLTLLIANTAVPTAVNGTMKAMRRSEIALAAAAADANSELFSLYRLRLVKTRESIEKTRSTVQAHTRSILVELMGLKTELGLTVADSQQQPPPPHPKSRAAVVSELGALGNQLLGACELLIDLFIVDQ